MAGAVYEFQVARPVGPVTRSTLPEFTVCAGSVGTVLTGRVDDPAEVGNLLRRLTDRGIVVTHLLITDPGRRRPTIDGEQRSTAGGDAAPQHGRSRCRPAVACTP